MHHSLQLNCQGKREVTAEITNNGYCESKCDDFVDMDAQ